MYFTTSGFIALKFFLLSLNVYRLCKYGPVVVHSIAAGSIHFFARVCECVWDVY